MLKALFRPALDAARRFARGRRLRRVEANLPPVIVLPLRALVRGKADPGTERIADRIEAQRARVAARRDEPVDILYSPRPGSAGPEPAAAALRPSPGERMRFDWPQVARTGKGRRVGTFLHLLANEARARHILELGTCAGISGSYLGSVPACERFTTVEASPRLCEVAREVLAVTAPGARVVNGLFDEALDQLLPSLDPVDFLFIDGHHEKVATIHYWQRVAPKLADRAIVVFDDISWSQDMREGWDFLRRQPAFSHAFDLGSMGVCIHSIVPAEPRQWDLRALTGTRKISSPWGWR